jgi:hypothetical protein
MYIGFTHKTSKILPRIFCRRFRHCACLTPLGGKCRRKPTSGGYIMIHFVRPGKIEMIPLSARDIKILEQHGWVFFNYEVRSMKYEIKPQDDIHISYFLLHNSITCVALAKKILCIRNPFIQTPYALYKWLGIRN